MVYYVNAILETLLAITILWGTRQSSKGILGTPVLSAKRKKVYCMIASFMWIMISGLRHFRVGSDTAAYLISFDTTKSMSWSYLWGLVREGFLTGDPGYNLFVKITQIVTENHQVFLLLIACIFMVPFGIWVYKESKNPLISFLLFSVLFYAFFALTGIRQTIATALVVLIGDRFIKERKPVKFVLLFIVAALIHKSCLVFLPFYFLSRLKVTWKSSLVWSGLIVGAFIFRYPLKELMISVSGYTQYANDYEGAKTLVFTIMLTIIYLLSVYASWRGVQRVETQRLYNALRMAMFFLPLTWINPSAMRAVQYFSIYLVLLIPEIIDVTFKQEDRKIVNSMICVILLFLLIMSSPTYMFFWQ